MAHASGKQLKEGLLSKDMVELVALKQRVDALTKELSILKKHVMTHKKTWLDRILGR